MSSDIADISKELVRELEGLNLHYKPGTQPIDLSDSEGEGNVEAITNEMSNLLHRSSSLGPGFVIQGPPSVPGSNLVRGPARSTSEIAPSGISSTQLDANARPFVPSNAGGFFPNPPHLDASDTSSSVGNMTTAIEDQAQLYDILSDLIPSGLPKRGEYIDKISSSYANRDSKLLGSCIRDLIYDARTFPSQERGRSQSRAPKPPKDLLVQWVRSCVDGTNVPPPWIDALHQRLTASDLDALVSLPPSGVFVGILRKIRSQDVIVPRIRTFIRTSLDAYHSRL